MLLTILQVQADEADEQNIPLNIPPSGLYGEVSSFAHLESIESTSYNR